eukprot:TRINITY_DN25814_c0_g2_i2.p2 TRINITY_DN25814_c0_g2~~TRINITY_DN25814_c0_g2_i2.p2  ORF type:complete len:104 (-),score=10.68 TRINITY_DN25814_c0_g2_i2:34-345(-)
MSQERFFGLVEQNQTLQEEEEKNNVVKITTPFQTHQFKNKHLFQNQDEPNPNRKQNTINNDIDSRKKNNNVQPKFYEKILNLNFIKISKQKVINKYINQQIRC